MFSIQELLPHIEILESGACLALTPAPRPFSVVSVGVPPYDPQGRRSANARLIRVGWVAMTCAERTQAIFGCEPVLVGPGEDLDAARLAFSMLRAGELLEAHPRGTVALIAGPLPSLDASSDDLVHALLEALGRARAADATMLGYVPHPCPELFDGWLRPGERTPWSRSSGLLWCYAHTGEQVLRLEAYEIPPDQHDRVAAIAVTQLRRGLPMAGNSADSPPETADASGGPGVLAWD